MTVLTADTYAGCTEQQDKLWAQGTPVHNHVDGECCLDFSCCEPDLFEKDESKRWAYYHKKHGGLN